MNRTQMSCGKLLFLSILLMIFLEYLWQEQGIGQ